MGSLRKFALAGAAVITTIPAALAADLPPAVYKAPVAAVEELAGGWYLRGDIGFTNQQARSTNYNFGTLAPPTSVRTVSKEFETGGIFGIGIGYQLNSWLRADVTGEYRTASTFHGYEIVSSGGNLIPEHNTLVKSEWVALANVYADLGTWWCITPFIGAGVGVANVRLSGFQDTVIGSLPGGLINGNNSADAGSQWNFAWALHAGLAYKVTPGFTVELAYRYLNLGDGATGTPITGFDGSYQGAKYEINNIYSHDVKLGVRWMLQPEPAYVAPLVRKG